VRCRKGAGVARRAVVVVEVCWCCEVVRLAEIEEWRSALGVEAAITTEGQTRLHHDDNSRLRGRFLIYHWQSRLIYHFAFSFVCFTVRRATNNVTADLICNGILCYIVQRHYEYAIHTMNNPINPNSRHFCSSQFWRFPSALQTSSPHEQVAPPASGPSSAGPSSPRPRQSPVVSEHRSTMRSEC